MLEAVPVSASVSVYSTNKFLLQQPARLDASTTASLDLLTAQARDRPTVPCLGTVGSGNRSLWDRRQSQPADELPCQGDRR